MIMQVGVVFTHDLAALSDYPQGVSPPGKQTRRSEHVLDVTKIMGQALGPLELQIL